MSPGRMTSAGSRLAVPVVMDPTRVERCALGSSGCESKRRRVRGASTAVVTIVTRRAASESLPFQRQGDEMKRTRTIVVAVVAVAVAAVAVGYGSGAAGQRAPSAAPTGSDPAALVKAHSGGTLRLLAKAAAGTIDPHVNYALPVLAALPGHVRRTARIHEGGRQQGVRGRPGSRDDGAQPDEQR